MQTRPFGPQPQSHFPFHHGTNPLPVSPNPRRPPPAVISRNDPVFRRIDPYLLENLELRPLSGPNSRINSEVLRSSPPLRSTSGGLDGIIMTPGTSTNPSRAASWTPSRVYSRTPSLGWAMPAPLPSDPEPQLPPPAYESVSGHITPARAQTQRHAQTQTHGATRGQNSTQSDIESQRSYNAMMYVNHNLSAFTPLSPLKFPRLHQERCSRPAGDESAGALCMSLSA